MEAHIFKEDGEWGGIIDRTSSPDIDPALHTELDAKYAELEHNVAQEAALEHQQVADASCNLLCTCTTCVRCLVVTSRGSYIFTHVIKL